MIFVSGFIEQIVSDIRNELISLLVGSRCFLSALLIRSAVGEGFNKCDAGTEELSASEGPWIQELVVVAGCVVVLAGFSTRFVSFMYFVW